MNMKEGRGTWHAALWRNPASVVGRFFLFGLALFICTFPPAFAQDSSPPAVVWFADHTNLVQVDPKTDQVALSIALTSESDVVAVDPSDGSAWIGTNRRLQKYDRSGVLKQEIDLRPLSRNLGEPKHLLLNPHDSSLWVIAERVVVRLNAGGQLVGETVLTDSVRSAALDLDDHLWLVSGKQLLRLSPDLVVQSTQNLQSLLSSPRHVAVDRLGGRLWLAGQGELLALDAVNPAQSLVRIALASALGIQGSAGEIDALAVHPVFGTVWVVTRQTLLLYDRQGQFLRQVPLASYDLGEIEAAVFDPVGFGLWLGGKKALGHFQSNGVFVGRIPVQNELEALATTPFRLRPVLSLLAPPDKTVTNNAFTALRYGLGSDCTGTPCYLEPVFTRSFGLNVDVGGQAIGPLFTLSPDEAAYMPLTRWPEGSHQVEASATDRYGHKSESITSRFTVDTIPPRFITVAPADGSFFSTPAVTITGSVNEDGANVVLSRNGTFLSMVGASFSFAVTLVPGPNIFELTATDPAGNSGRMVLNLVLDSTPPSIPNGGLITIGFSIDGLASVAGAAGAVEGGAKVTIRNLRTGETVTVTANADGSFSARIAAQPGDEIAITAKDAAGNESEVLRKSIPFQGVGVGNVIGTVLDAASDQPLAGARVFIKELNTTITTDGAGRFTLAAPGRYTWSLYFERDGFITARRDFYVRPGGTVTVGEVKLRAWDGRVTRIRAATGGTYTDSTGNVEVIFPPGALPRDLDIRGSYLPDRESFPAKLAENMIYAGGVQMGPEHTVFNSPVTVRLRNTLGLPPGMEMPFAFASHDPEDPNPSFYDPGTAIVSADGRTIEFQVRHFSCAALGPKPPGSPGDGPDDGDDTEDDDDEDDDDCQDGSSTVSHCRGKLKLRHRLPAFHAFGRNDAPTLVYSSSTADPRPLVSSSVNMAGFFNPLVPPESLRARLTFEGKTTEMHIDPVAGRLPLHITQDATNAQGQTLPTGSYSYQLEVANVSRDAPLPGSGTVSVPTSPYAQPSPINGRVIVNNQSQSPFGAGWGLAELQRIYRNDDGTLLLTRGSGDATVFYPDERLVPGSGGLRTFATGLGDSRSIAAYPGGGLVVSSHSTGNVYRIAPDGNRTLLGTVPSSTGIAAAADGTVYVLSNTTRRLHRITPGSAPQVFVAFTTVVDHLDDLAIGPEGDVYVLDGGYGIIHRVTPTGQTSIFYNGLTQGRFISNGMGMVFDRQGNLYVANNYNNFGQARCGVSYISRFDRFGNHSYYHLGLNAPRGLAIDEGGNLFVADYDCENGGYQIKVITPVGERYLVSSGIAGNLSAFGLAYDMVMAAGQLYLVRSEGDVLTLAPLLDSRTASRYKARGGEFSDIQQDSAGNLTRVERSGTVHRFNAQGLHLETRVPQGRFWRYEYDAQGRITGRSNTAGQRWEFRYGPNNAVSEIVDPAGRSARLVIDDNNNLVRVVEPEDASMSYTYDASHRVATKTDSRGNTSSYVYEPVLGGLAEVRQPNGERRLFSSGRSRVGVTAARAAGSSIGNRLSLGTVPSEDTYTNGRGIASRRLTNRFGSALQRVDGVGNLTSLSRNRRNQITSIARPNGATETFTYDRNNLLTQRSQTGGFSANYTYDSRYRLTSVVGSYAPTQRYTYDERSNLVSVDIGNGSVVSRFSYNGLGLPVTSEVAGRITSYEYDTAGRLTRVTNPMSETTEYEYDAAGNRTLVRNALGRETRLTYDGLGRLVSITDPSGDTVQMGYRSGCATCGTAAQLLTSVTDALGRATRFEYNEFGQRIREIDPAGNVATLGYDGNRNLSSVTRPDDTVIRYEYDENDRLLRKTLPTETVEYRYDAMGNMISATDGDSTINNTFDSANRLTRILTNGASQASSDLAQEFSGYRRASLSANAGSISDLTGFGYDNLHRISSISGSSPAGAYVLSYDGLGQRSQLAYPNGDLLSYRYDDASRLLGLSGTGFLGSIEYTYDTVGRRIAETQIVSARPLLTLTLDRAEITADNLAVSGRVSGGTATVTVAGQTFAVNPDGTFSGAIPIGVGNNDIVVTVTDANGLTVSDQRSVLRSPPVTNLNLASIEAVSQNGDIYVTESMPAGSVQGAVLAAGTGALFRPAWLAAATDISVDGAGRVYTLQGGRVSVYNGSTNNLVADVSALGITDIEAAPDGTVYFANNTGTLYRLQGGQAVTFATLPVSGETRLEASNFGLVAHVDRDFYRVNPDGSSVLLFISGYGPDFSLDDAGTICYQDEGIVCRDLAGNENWLPFSAASLESSPVGVLHYVNPDNVYRWNGSQSIPLISGTATATPIGASLTIEAVLGDGESRQYTYDAKDQLTTATGGRAGSESYAYDPAGNRTRDQRASDYVHNNLNQLVSGSGYTYTYDVRGNRTAKTGTEGTTRYRYDAENRLIRIDFAQDGYAEYAYDPFWRRIQKRVVSAQNQETIRRYVYDREDILFELDGNNQVLTRFLHGPGIDEPLAFTRNGQTYRYHADVLGSIVAITDQNRNIVQRYTYDAYGNLTAANPDFQQPYAYTGREYDEESGLYYYRARYYDPAVGRFITADPRGINEHVQGYRAGLRAGVMNRPPLELNPYRYVRNNPLRWRDPLGLDIAGGWEPGDEPIAPGPDYCTSVPDLFPESCKKHDQCYYNPETCEPEKPKSQCDKDFRDNMREERPDLPEYISEVYYLGVKVGGGGYYGQP